MSRKESDPCLLCGNQNASKRNSHIIPKFISSDFLGEKSQKKGFDISSDKGVSKGIQDSPKEDFILCPDCEAFFSILEGAVAQHIKDLHDKTTGPIKEPVVLQCDAVSSELFHLFFYSIFWRVSISGLPIFALFILTPELEDYLKTELNKFRSSIKTDFAQKVVQETLNKVVPYGVLTSLTFSDKTKNVIFAPGVSSPWSLNADKFGLIIYDQDATIDPPFDSMFNTGNDHKKVTIMPESLWEEVMVKKPLQIAADQRNKSLARIGKLKSLAEALSKLSNKEAKELREMLGDNLHDI